MALMIEVENLTKWYGRTLALDRASFSVEKGQIVGFLGPNGAGKSTTLRILTGYLPATGGKARVDGHDACWRASPSGLPSGTCPRTCRCTPRCGLTSTCGSGAGRRACPGAAAAQPPIRPSSGAGWRHAAAPGGRTRRDSGSGWAWPTPSADPPLLVLDEPTIGLDPTQVEEVRKLIRSLGGSHTVLLSSHILPEVEKTCSHLVIISGGRIAAAGTVEELKVGLSPRNRVVLEIRQGRTSDGHAEMARAIGQVPGVAETAREDLTDGWIRFTVTWAAGPTARGPVRPGGPRGWQLRRSPAGPDARGTVGPGDRRRHRPRKIRRLTWRSLFPSPLVERVG